MISWRLKLLPRRCRWCDLVTATACGSHASACIRKWIIMFWCIRKHGKHRMSVCIQTKRYQSIVSWVLCKSLCGVFPCCWQIFHMRFFFRCDGFHKWINVHHLLKKKFFCHNNLGINEMSGAMWQRNLLATISNNRQSQSASSLQHADFGGFFRAGGRRTASDAVPFCSKRAFE